MKASAPNGSPVRCSTGSPICKRQSNYPSLKRPGNPVAPE